MKLKYEKILIATYIHFKFYFLCPLWESKILFRSISLMLKNIEMMKYGIVYGESENTV